MKFTILTLAFLVMSVGTAHDARPVTPMENVQIEASGSLPWWNDRVFYEVFVRSFYDSDGDGIGDLHGVLEKLDYLNDGDPASTTDLGITGLWLMPIQGALSYHGYDVLDYRSINPQYGTFEDLRALIDAAHARGIVVIVDLILNHTARLHPWFRASARGQSPYADWYVWREENPGYRGPDNQTVWHSLGSRYYYGVFGDGMPDLNLANAEVTDALYDVARYWLEDVGVDGFRLDAVRHYIEEGELQENTQATIDWTRSLRTYVQSVRPDALLVGEVWSSSFEVAPYIPESLDLAFEFDLATAITFGVRSRNPGAIAALAARTVELYPPGQFATFLTNHDQNRIMSELRGDAGAAKAAASILLTLPGVPFLYYGEEIGMMGTKPDERIRTPMQWTNEPETAGFTTGRPWESLASEGLASTVSTQTDDPQSLLSHYRTLIHLRAAQPALRRGDWLPVETNNRRVLAYLRRYEGEAILVVIHVDRRATSDYSLSIDTGLGTVESAEPLFGAPASSGVPAPNVNEVGGFTGYVPVEELGPYMAVLVKLRTAVSP